MRLHTIVAATLFAAAVSWAGDSVTMTYVANGGFLVAEGESKVLVDALFRDGIPPYVAPDEAMRRKAEAAEGPFAGVDFVLVTHHHADHYDAAAVLAHLRANPDAVFVSTVQAVDLMRGMDGYDAVQDRVHAVVPEEGKTARVEHGGMTVEVLNLHHGRDRPIQNNGYVFTVGSTTYFHMGDTEVTAADLAAYDLRSRDIDVALVPYWFLEYAEGREAIREGVAPERIVAMHVPGPSAEHDWVPDEAGWADWVDRLESRMTGVTILRTHGDSE